jgi:plastocyanin
MCIRHELRGLVIAAALGAVSAGGIAPIVVPALAQNASAVSAGAVSIDNFTFNPPTLRVKSGTKVTWTNKDDIPHGIASSANTFARSQALDTDDSFSFTFDKPGTYQYFCYIHPHMVGTIVVEGTTGNAAQ